MQFRHLIWGFYAEFGYVPENVVYTDDKKVAVRLDVGQINIGKAFGI